MMVVLDLFCGTKSFANTAYKMGIETITIDIDPQFNPDICADISRLDSLPKADVIWASPPCTCFSIASASTHWHIPGCPKSKEAVEAYALLLNTLYLIDNSGCKYFFIENPRGLMRKLPVMRQYPRRTLTYCRYGDTRMKPTDIWTNCKHWIPKPMCKNGSRCHEHAPRGSKTGTQGLKNAKDRGKVPYKLCREILLSCY